MDSKYEKVDDNKKPLWIAIAIFIIISFLINLFVGFTVTSIFIEITVMGSILIPYEGFRPRSCPKCGQKMIRESDGLETPEAHHCKTCKVYISTGVGSFSS